MNLRILVLAAVVAGATLTAGVQLVNAQDGDTTAPPRTPICDLVTTSEAEAALGHPVVTNDVGSACAYTPATVGASTALTITLGPEGITAETFAQGMSTYAGAAGATLRQVSGTGDEAWATVADPASQIIARKGEKFVSIVLVNSKAPADERVSALAGLARAALSRMG